MPEPIESQAVNASVPETIEKTPGVCGGAARIRGHPYPRLAPGRGADSGATEAELLLDYPSLTAQDLIDAWGYAEEHADEIAAEVRRNEVAWSCNVGFAP